MKSFLKLLTIAVALVTAIPSFAVTDKEMEQARAIAAKHYLRYANNGSDYLDKLSPSTVSELTKSLKTKELENIKSFNAVAVPKDYASWDKKKLVDYWSNTFFKSPGLKDDGKKCLSILAKNLNKINVSASSATPKPAEPSGSEAKPTETKPAEKPEAAGTDPAVESPVTPSSDPVAADNHSMVDDQVVDEASVVAQAVADAGIAEEQPRKSSNTGWYIGILVLLVGVVIWLVMYASKSMKETGATIADNKIGEKEIREAKRVAKEELNKMREQYASSLNSKNEEIKQLKARCDALEGKLDATRRELDSAKRELTSLRQSTPRPRPQQSKVNDPKPASAPSVSQEVSVKQQGTVRRGGLPPVVFLSYVNQKGLFVKASRSLNLENSVYRMDIPDGHHGTFRVINDTDILDRLLDNPDQWLGGGCVMENPEDADIATEIVTLEPGEALFADNSCRVTKKARIKFI